MHSFPSLFVASPHNECQQNFPIDVLPADVPHASDPETSPQEFYHALLSCATLPRCFPRLTIPSKSCKSPFLFASVSFLHFCARVYDLGRPVSSKQSHIVYRCRVFCSSSGGFTYEVWWNVA